MRGIAGLRVIDSSVFPTEPNGNLNAATIMLAERAADLVRGLEPLQSNDVPVGRWRAGKPARAVASRNANT